MTLEERTKLLRQICEEVINLPKQCATWDGLGEMPLPLVRVQNKVKPVIGEGSHTAHIMFVGEAPGKNEAEQGRPFCGAAGRILDELFLSAGMDRKASYVTNIVKDRPPGNRDPLPEEIQLYQSFLDRQIGIIQPAVIAALGRFSMDYLMRKFGLEHELGPISKIHGRVFVAEAPYGQIKVVPLLHPAVAVYNPTAKDELKKDFQALKML